MKVASRAGAVALATAGFVAVAAAVALAKVQLPAYDGPIVAGKNPQVRPGTIIYTGDGSGVLAGRGTRSRHPKFGRLHWTSWNATEARAFGADWVNNCVPFCAAGTFTPYPVNIRAFRPRVVEHHRIFTRMQVTYTGKRPARVHSRVQIWTVDDGHGQYFWRFPF
jgi:hypothetical protein